MTGPERIWIEGEEECPYFYGESELADASGPLVGYVRADIHDEVVKALREALRKIFNCGQSAEPDHWKFRCMAREVARAALARTILPIDTTDQNV